MDPSLVSICECRYCGDHFTSRGIDAHEQWCDDNPYPGVMPDEQEKLIEKGVLEPQ